MRHRSTPADPGPYRAVDTLRDFRECHGGDRLGHAIVRACRSDPRRRLWSGVITARFAPPLGSVDHSWLHEFEV